jgi:hypothetical protein
MTLLTIPLEAESGGVNHWVIGGVTLAIFLLLLWAFLAFGKGRDHS